MPRGTRVPSVAEYNQIAILSEVRRHSDGVTRHSLSEATGLSPQTITNATRGLIDQSIVLETRRPVSGRGQPARLLQLNPNGLFAFGLHIDPSVVTLVLVNLDGDVMSRHTISPVPEDPNDVIRLIARKTKQSIEEANIETSKIIGLGVAAPGPLDTDAGTLTRPRHFEAWDRYPLKSGLEEAVGVRVILQKDVTAAAIGEMWLGDATTKAKGSFAFFYYGTGAGIGLVLDGVPVRGATSNAGEGGTLRVPVPQRAGAAGDALARLVVPRQLVERAVESGADMPSHSSEPETGDASFIRLIDAAERGDDAARSTIDEAAAMIGATLVPLINLLDIDRVVFGGPSWRQAGPLMADRIRTVINSSPDRSTRYAVTVDTSLAGDDVVAMGAAYDVFDAALTPRVSSLLIGSRRSTA